MAKTFEAIISVLDKASKPILDLEEKLKKLASQGKSTQHSLVMSPHQKLWHELNEHVAVANEKFKGLGENIGEMGARLGEVLPMLGVVGGLGSAAGLIELAHATAEAAEALHNVSLITGVAVPQLQALDFAGKQVGLSSDQMSAGLERLNVNLGKAAEGQNKQASALFKAMGINLKDAKGHVKDITDILPQLEASFQKTTNPTQRAAMAQTLFGKAGEDLLPFLTMGPAALQKLQDQFDKFGYSFSDEDQEGLEKFNDAWKDTQLSVEGLGDAIGASLAPVMTPLLEDFAVFISQNRAIISADLKTVFKGIGGELAKVDFKTVSSDAKAFAGNVENVISDVGGMKTVMIGAGLAVTADFLSPLILLTAQMGKLAFSMGAPIAGAFVQFGADLLALNPELKSFRDVMLAVDLALDANPILRVVAAVTSLAVVGKYLYDNWQPLDAFLGKISGEIDDLGKKMLTLDGIIGGGSATPAPGQGAGAEQTSDGRVWHPSARGGFFTSPGQSSSGNNPSFNGLNSSAGNPRPPLNSPKSSVPTGGRHTLDINMYGFPSGTKVAAKASGNAAPARVTNTGRNSLGQDGH